MPGIATRSRKSDRTEALETAFAARYEEYQYRFVEFFVDHLSDLGRAFGGDLQQMLVLAILGQVRLASLRERNQGEDEEPRQTGLTSSRIADVTGIPRETVRRKLAALAERGWVARTQRGMWHLARAESGSVARQELAEFDRRALRRVARMVAELEEIS